MQMSIFKTVSCQNAEIRLSKHMIYDHTCSIKFSIRWLPNVKINKPDKEAGDMSNQME